MNRVRDERKKKLRGGKGGGEISEKDDASREEIGEKQKQRGKETQKKRRELKEIIYLSGINREAYRMERI